MVTNGSAMPYAIFDRRKGGREKGRNGPNKRDARKSVRRPSAEAASAGVDSTDR